LFLGQRDGYHSYTVGWHSILCLEKIEQMEQEPEFGDDPEINWPVLKLAALTHDLGKGLGGEHEKAGVLIGLEQAVRLKLDPDSADLLTFLIREHLLLNHYAYRRDFYEAKASEYMADRIRGSSRLKLLFMLTCADIQAVSDSSWTKWKDDLLRSLYHMLLAHLEKNETPSKQVSDRLKILKEMMLERGVAEWRAKELEKLPTRYLLGTSPQKIVEQMEMVDRKQPQEIQVRVRKLEKPRLEVVVICDDHPGLFSELSGVMSALNCNILSAEINTMESTVLDIFVVEDMLAGRSEHWDQEADNRSRKLSQTLTDAAAETISVQELVSKKKGVFKPKTRFEIPVEVHPDQESSDSYTILEVQAPDQPGLLYKITRSIFERHLDIQFAKISTRAEKVFDVFYLRDPVSNGKASDEEIVQLVRSLTLSLRSSAEQK
jgi:[protein-PII] uridylyltransferase